jgi:hypothetical protein
MEVRLRVVGREVIPKDVSGKKFDLREAHSGTGKSRRKKMSGDVEGGALLKGTEELGSGNVVKIKLADVADLKSA